MRLSVVLTPTIITIFALFSCKIQKSNVESSVETHNGSTYPKKQAILTFLKQSLDNPEDVFYGKISRFSAAFHQPLILDSSLDYLAEEEKAGLRMAVLEEPTYSCHQIAQNVRDVLGTGEEISVGGVGQKNRSAAIDAAIYYINEGNPVIVSLKNASKGDDGHSFSLILRPDGYVDTLEGWAARYDPSRTWTPDVTVGKKQGTKKNLIIEALEKIRLSPTEQGNDAMRGEGYRVLSQAYDDSTLYHLLPKNERTRHNIVEREDNNIEITARIRQLKTPGDIQKTLRKQLMEQENILQTLPISGVK